jgi:hypothetical protein
MVKNICERVPSLFPKFKNILRTGRYNEMHYHVLIEAVRQLVKDRIIEMRADF